MQQANPMQQFQLLRTKKLKETIFTGNLPSDFNAWKDEAMKNESRASLQVSIDELKALHTKKDGVPYTFFEVATVLNSLEEKTPEQLKECTHAYLDIQETISNVAKNWNELVKPIEQQVSNELQEEFEKMKPKEPFTGLPGGGLKPVMGQA